MYTIQYEHILSSLRHTSMRFFVYKTKICINKSSKIHFIVYKWTFFQPSLANINTRLLMSLKIPRWQ